MCSWGLKVVFSDFQRFFLTISCHDNEIITVFQYFGYKLSKLDTSNIRDYWIQVKGTRSHIEIITVFHYFGYKHRILDKNNIIMRVKSTCIRSHFGISTVFQVNTPFQIHMQIYILYIYEGMPHLEVFFICA